MDTLKIEEDSFDSRKLTLGGNGSKTYLVVTDHVGAGVISLSRKNLIDLSEWIEDRLEELSRSK